MKELLESLKKSGNKVHVNFSCGNEIFGEVIDVREEYFTVSLKGKQIHRR